MLFGNEKKKYNNPILYRKIEKKIGNNAHPSFILLPLLSNYDNKLDFSTIRSTLRF